jgi:hypothetical protein
MARRRMGLRAALLAASVLAGWSHGGIARYGSGDYASSDQLPARSPLRGAADAALIMFLTDKYQPSRSALDLTPVGLCPGNSLAAEDDLRIDGPSCSATLISPTRVMTAAHCLQKTEDPADGQLPIELINVMADFVRKPASTPLPVASTSVRSISKVLYCALDPGSDVAVLELDAPLDRPPVRRAQATIVVGQAAHLVSFPLGLPLAISTCVAHAGSCVQARIAGVSKTMFRAPLDSYHGSSGGSVVNDDGELIGIFHGGPPQLEKPHPPDTLCSTDIVYADDCLGEVISRVDTLPADLFDDSKVLPGVQCTFGGNPPSCAGCAAQPKP